MLRKLNLRSECLVRNFKLLSKKEREVQGEQTNGWSRKKGQRRRRTSGILLR